MAQIPHSFLRAFDENGDPVSGALLYVYEDETTTPVTTYSDEALSVAQTHPVVADAEGQFAPIYTSEDVWRVDVRTPAGASLPGYPMDHVVAVATDADLIGLTALLVGAEPQVKIKPATEVNPSIDLEDMSGTYALRIQMSRATGNLLFATGSATSDIRYNGTFPATAAAAGVILSREMGDARFAPIASASRYKLGVEPFGRDAGAIIDALEVKQWVWGGALDSDDPRRATPGFGLIAEEVEDHAPEAVVRNRDGRVEGLSPLPLLALLWGEVQSLRERVAELEGAE